jgi:hypothetical protein
MTLPKYSQPEQETPTTFPRTDWQGLFFDSADGGKLKRIDDAGNVVDVEGTTGLLGLDDGGTGADLSSGQGVLVQSTSGANVSSLGGSGVLKLASDVPSVAALLRSEMPTGALFVDAAISGTLQAVEDAAGNASGLKIGTGDIEVNGITIGRGSGGEITNIVVGFNSFQSNTTGIQNTAFGGNTLQSNTTGSQNTAIGQGAGRYAGGGTTPNETSSECLYIGRLVRAGADGRQKENVIGYNITGNGDNTTTIGEKPVFPDMPTSSAGLPSGALWNDSGTVKIV